MKIKTVSYQKVFPLGQFINERIGVECEINEMENPATILQEAKLMVEKFHKDSNPGLYIETNQDILNGFRHNGVSPYFHPPTTGSADLTYGSSSAVPILGTTTNPKDAQINNFIEAISTTKTIKNLEIFKKLVDRENNPALTTIYNQRLKELQSWIGAK